MHSYSVSTYKVIYDKDLCTIFLYLNPGDFNTEFAEEFGKNALQKEVTQFINHNFNFIAKKTVKIFMGTTLLATFTVAGALPSLAAEESSSTTANQTITTTESGIAETQETTIEPTTPTTTTTEPTTTPTEPTTTTETPPTLVPGDFFYFVKILMEKIQVSLTFNDVAKAQKLADFAGERIAEARVLLANGDTTGASDLLNKALETQDLALNYSAEAGMNASEPTSDAQNQLTDQQKELLQTRDTMKAQFGNNILALLGALKNVKNPQAQASLTKNIEKSFNKLETKLGKLDQRQNQKESKPIQEQLANLQNTTQENITNNTDPTTAPVTPNVAPIVPVNTVKKGQDTSKENAKKSPQNQSNKQNQNQEKTQGNNGNQNHGKQAHESK